MWNPRNQYPRPLPSGFARFRLPLQSPAVMEHGEANYGPERTKLFPSTQTPQAVNLSRAQQISDTGMLRSVVPVAPPLISPPLNAFVRPPFQPPFATGPAGDARTSLPPQGTCMTKNEHRQFPSALLAGLWNTLESRSGSPPDDVTFVKEMENILMSRKNGRNNNETRSGISLDKPKEMSLKEAKGHIEDVQTLLREIAGLRDYLIDNMRIDDAEWVKTVEKIQFLKAKLEEKKSALVEPAVVKSLQLKILQRKKKREKVRKKKSVTKKERIAAMMERVKRHREIDEWQHKLMLKDKANRLVESLRSEAGETLAEVRKKKSDIEKLAGTLTSIKELRSIRRQTSLSRGVFVFEDDDEVFEERILKLVRLTEARKKIYEEEETALLVMMKEEREEFTRVEEEKRKQRLREEEEKESNNPLLPYLKYWLQAEDSVESLIRIREFCNVDVKASSLIKFCSSSEAAWAAWDIYISPPHILGASRIPDGWVTPPETASALWKSYAHKKK